MALCIMSLVKVYITVGDDMKTATWRGQREEYEGSNFIAHFPGREKLQGNSIAKLKLCFK